MLIWLTNVFNASPEQIIEDYRNAGIEVLRRDILHKMAVIGD
ncbi:MAG: hypothetical protein WAV32_03540 [Halobacteriota archaeon]